jgi:hypothetical protein
MQGFKGFLDRSAVIPPMDLVEVDIVSAEARQAVVDLGQDGLAGQSLTIGPRPHAAVDLGGDDDFFPGDIRQKSLADDLLAATG